MSGPDPIAVVALIVSLIALIISLLQVAQQFIATANDYRHCSKRTVGEWSRRRSRRLIWSELRFEVLFTTPIISIEFLPSGTNMAGGDIYAVPTTTRTRLDSHTSNEKEQASANATNLSSLPSEYVSSSGTHFILHSSKGTETRTSSQKPWFLDDKGTLPEAKCSWLTLLNDVAITHLRIDINERSLSYDFMPDGIKKPLAQIDRRSFLTLMSLFQVSWQGGQGGKDTPTGAGPYCEITTRNLVNFGTVVSYQHTAIQPTRWFYIVSEKARAAMFNRFDLSFHVVLTHSADEVYESVLALAGDSAASTIQGFNNANNGWSPGLSEVIGCFAEPEMPKAIEYGTDKFVSIFSTRSIPCILHDYPVIQLLTGKKIKNSTADAEKFSKWAKDYIDFSSHDDDDDDVRLPTDQLRAALEFACEFAESRWQKRRVGEPISWSQSRLALTMIKLLDKQLTTLCHRLAPTQPELEVQREFARLQIRIGCSLFHDTRALEQGGFWQDFIGRVVATNYVKICFDLEEKYQKSEQVRSSLIINRLMRGVLWHIHNGNYPIDERQLECSLNSRWLSDTSTIWID